MCVKSYRGVSEKQGRFVLVVCGPDLEVEGVERHDCREAFEKLLLLAQRYDND